MEKNFINLSFDIFSSVAWHSITSKQKELYLYCVLQAQKNSLSNTPIRYDKNENCFVFYRDLWLNEYGLYGKAGQRHFYEDIDALISNGFVEKLESGKSTRTYNIYCLCDKWKSFGNYIANKPITTKKQAEIGYVYLVESENLYKIGKTKNPTSRMNYYSTMPNKAELLFIEKVKNYSDCEKELHLFFAEKNYRGEWFTLDDSDIEVMKNYLTEQKA